MTQPVPYSSERTCDVCGKFGAFEFDGESLCSDCYQGRGSCCAEREEDCENLKPFCSREDRSG